ncbi:PspC domain-containing protein [Caldalkalibacillus mannanilyticus]|uniref:PspC domain-containing protein n=1 Tax=Caldalkalibacillus mannanilyticus TaxID=1418 RepID=UPI00046A8278|nr:PspC domain-containing protein [Caldalkalibacillus mannanilyticus]
MKKLVRAHHNRMIGGICGGLGEYFNVDTTFIRLGFVLGLFMSFGTMAVVYLVGMVIIPTEERV